MDNDKFNQIPSNISSVVDLLEDKGISWGHYEEDMPYSGFEGIAWVNQRNGANDYVRKHSKRFRDTSILLFVFSEKAETVSKSIHISDPAIIYNSVTNDPSRLANIKNLTMFYKDLQANQLPQWMFITPNMSESFLYPSPSSVNTADRFLATPLPHS